jgi:alcohol dehydrogenase
MMGLSFAQAMFKQKIAVADLSPAARESALKNGAASLTIRPSRRGQAHDQGRTEGGFDEIVDFAGNEKVDGVRGVGGGARRQDRGVRPDGRQFQPADGAMGLQAHDHRGFMVGTLAEAKELMALARAGKIKPTR